MTNSAANRYEKLRRRRKCPKSAQRCPKFSAGGQYTLLYDILDDLGTSRSASQECSKAFEGRALFDYPKPVALIQHLLELALPNGGRVLDFFAGSGTTGVACLALEQQSKCTYPCILIQKPEPFDGCRHASHVTWASQQGVPANVASLTWHRIQASADDSQQWTRHHIRRG